MCVSVIRRRGLSERLAILVWAAGPDRPDLVVTPLVHALAACALDAEVELHFAGPAVRWLVAGVAEEASSGGDKTVAAFFTELVAAGVSLLACSMAVSRWRQPDEMLLPDCRQAGATAFVARVLDPDWQTLVF